MATSIYSAAESSDGTSYNGILNKSIYFGLSENRGHDFFTGTGIHFKFYDPFGEVISEAPEIYMQSPTQFESINQAAYESTGSIFGADADFSSAGSTIDSIRGSLAEALMSSVTKSFASFAGYFTSAGQSGIGQAEFMTKQLTNPLQQLLYKGPQYKPYALQFNLRPRNEAEAENLLSIISAFKIANSAKFTMNSAAVAQSGEVNVASAALDAASAIAGVPLTFGYPDLVEFEIIRFEGGAPQTIYESKKCAIETISTSYGQQKMAFFNSSSAASYPIETMLSLTLKEVVYRTNEDANLEATNSNITLR